MRSSNASEGVRRSATYRASQLLLQVQQARLWTAGHDLEGPETCQMLMYIEKGGGDLFYEGLAVSCLSQMKCRSLGGAMRAISNR